MKYYIDTEFIEGFHKPLFGKRRHFIDLISIGIVCEDSRTYSAISNEYKYKNADKWVQDNVIDPLYIPTVHGDSRNRCNSENFHLAYGKSNKQIAEEIRNFVMMEKYNSGGQVILGKFFPNDTPYPEFYGYYADYDWVLFCSLFGRMIDLPKGFPMYCKDLKQMMDETLQNYNKTVRYFDTERKMAFSDDFEELSFANAIKEKEIDLSKHDLKYKLEFIKKYHSGYPKQENEHNSLQDAKWNKQLHEFLIKL